MTPEDRDRHIRAIIGREGGWVDDPDDSGGPTNYGITLSVWLKFMAAFPPEGPKSAWSMYHANMTKSDAMAFYRWYFDTQGLGELMAEFGLTDEMVPLLMDMRTHHSLDGCRKIWQRAQRWQQTIPPWAVYVTLSRKRYMLEVAERRPKDRRYVRGWMHRALKAIGLWPPAAETTEV